MLAVAAAPESSTEAAVKALLELHGVDHPVASAILAAIFPERYTVLDYRTLEALGHARHDVHFYEEYLDFCKRLAESNIVKPQSELARPHAAAHARSRAVGVVAQPHRLITAGCHRNRRLRTLSFSGGMRLSRTDLRVPATSLEPRLAATALLPTVHGPSTTTHDPQSTVESLREQLVRNRAGASRRGPALPHRRSLRHRVRGPRPHNGRGHSAHRRRSRHSLTSSKPATTRPTAPA